MKLERESNALILIRALQRYIFKIGANYEKVIKIKFVHKI